MSIKRRAPIPLSALLALGLLLGPAVPQGRIETDAPVSGFKLPRFGPDGYKVWAIEGRRGIPGPTDDTLVIEGLRLSVYSGTEDLAVQYRIESPRARVDLETESASGSGLLVITGPGFQVSGLDWLWSGNTLEGEETTVILRQDARVAFDQDLRSLLD
ncbi:MAG: hypothetical protein ACFE0O_10885 [Opitutales bacterium]